MPARDRPFLDHGAPIPFAHRGDHRDPSIGENSMSAFAAAVALGYRYVETDVHVTADGVLVALHDDRLDRVTDRGGAIADLRWDDVRRAHLAGGETVPLFEDLLGGWPDLRVNIDVKHDAAVGPLVTVLERMNAFDRVGVGAFSDRRLTTVRRLTAGRVCTSMGPREVARLRAASIGVPVGRFASDCAQVPVRHGRVPIVDRRFVEAAHGRGLQVHVWTVDDPDQMRALLDLGVDGIMTDRPDLLKEVLVERGQWL